MTRKIATLTLERHNGNGFRSNSNSGIGTSQVLTQMRFAVNELGWTRSGMHSSGGEESRISDIPRALIVTMNAREHMCNRDNLAIPGNANYHSSSVGNTPQTEAEGNVDQTEGRT